MAVNTNTLLGIGIGFGAIGMIFGFVSMHRVDKITRKLGVAIDDMADSVEIDIPDSMIQEATDKAVDHAVSRAAADVAKQISREFDGEIRSEVRKSVANEKSMVREKVKEQIEKEIGYIDIEDAKAEVIQRAKSQAAERFKSDLDAILANHNKELDNISTIYSSIANTMKGAAQ